MAGNRKATATPASLFAQAEHYYQMADAWWTLRRGKADKYKRKGDLLWQQATTMKQAQTDGRQRLS
jgi:hypothetical protein